VELFGIAHFLDSLFQVMVQLGLAPRRLGMVR